MTGGKTVAIVGAGVAGLSAGCYLQMNGYRTEIFEMGERSGGVCASWKRKEYTFDGGVQYLVGSNPSDPLHALWEELGVADALTFVYPEEQTRIEYGNGSFFRAFCNIDRLAEEMRRIAPEDTRAALSLARTVKRLSQLAISLDKDYENSSLENNLPGSLVYFPLVAFNRKRTVREFVYQFKNPFLRESLTILAGDERVSALVLLMRLAAFHTNNAGRPRGGSRTVVQAIERMYRGLGGRIHYGSKVARVLVENNTAAGVELAKGGVQRSDAVVSAVDGNYTIFKMLEGKYAGKVIVDNYNTLELSPALIRVSLGIGRLFDDIPPAMNLLLDRPLTVDDKTRAGRLPVMICGCDPELAIDRRRSLAITMPADYEYWTTLRNNHFRRYLMEKERLVHEVTGILEKRLGDIARKVEAYDVATPSTYVSHTNNWKGSHAGWLPAPVALEKKMKYTVPGLARFYMAGQWVVPGGGLLPVALSGRNAARTMCRHDDKIFMTLSRQAMASCC